MFSIFFILLFGDGQASNLADMNVRLTSMENKVGRLESEIKSLKSKNQDFISSTLSYDRTYDNTICEHSISTSVFDLIRIAQKEILYTYNFAELLI